jgi:hypothetical protein
MGIDGGRRDGQSLCNYPDRGKRVFSEKGENFGVDIVKRGSPPQYIVFSDWFCPA